MFMYTLLAYAVSTVSLDVKYHPHAVGLRPLPTMFASSVGFFRKCQRPSRYEGASFKASSDHSDFLPKARPLLLLF